MSETRFGALRELRRDPRQAVVSEVAVQVTPRVVSSPVRATGKSSSPDFERLTIYVRKDTKKAATRKWEDATGRDMSDLVEDLLTHYLDT